MGLAKARPVIGGLFICLLLLGLTGRGNAQTQETPLVFYLGRQDTTLDGLISPEDAVSVFASYDDGRTIPISRPGESVLNYRANPTFDAAAYVAQTTEGVGLVVASANGTWLDFPLLGIPFALTERFDDAYVWLTGRDGTGQPLLIGLALASGTLSQYRLAAADATVLFNAAGDKALAYSISSGEVELLSLPALTPIPLALPERYISNPSWSASNDQFVAVTGASADATDAALLVFDATLEQMHRLALPFPAATLDVTPLWSATDTYISLNIPGNSPDASTASLAFITTSDGAVQTVEQPGADVRLIGWSSDDAYALLSENTYTASETVSEYALYRAAEQQVVSLDTINFVRPNLFAWLPNEYALGILGQSILDEQSGIFELDVESQTLTPLYTTADAALTEGGFVWRTDGRGAVIVSLEQDMVELLLGVEYRLDYLDRANGALTRLTPDTVSPLPYGLQIR